MVTIGQFQRVQKIISEHDDISAEILCVGELHGLSEKQVRDLPIDKWRELKKSLNVNLEPSKEVPADFAIDGTVYKVALNFEKSGQFMDYSELHKNPIENLHMILALFAKPDGEGYMDNFTKRAEIFKEKCPYEIAQSVAFFFSRFIQELSQSIKIYSQVPGLGGMKRNGAGRLPLKAFLTTTELNGNSSRKWGFWNSSTTSHR